MNRRAAILIFAGALVFIDALGRLLTGSSPSLVDDAAPGVASPTAAAVDDVLRDEFGPLLVQAANDARTLVELGETKDRNLFRIREGQAAMERSLLAADGWLTRNPSLHADAAAATYRDGASRIRAAMDEAQQGFRRLDFDRVAQATETMREGERLLRDAQRLLEPSG
jgi:paraquat-inducible protein B